MVREYKGAFSGEHGDGLVRSEWVAWQFGPRLTRAFEEIKALFDPAGLMNPGKIVRRVADGRRDAVPLSAGATAWCRSSPALDWSAWNVQNDPVADTRDRARHGRRSRGRLRQGRRDVQQQRPLPQVRRRHDVPELSRHARRAASDARARQHAAPRAVGPARRRRARVAGGARRARPVRELQGLPARMSHRRRHGEDEDRVRCYQWQQDARPAAARSARSRICRAGRRRRRACPGSPTCAIASPGCARLGERRLGIAAQRSLPRMARATRSCADAPRRAWRPADVVLFVDTFTNYFEPENAHAALAVLSAAGYRVAIARAGDRRRRAQRPLCCGRTYLARRHGRRGARAKRGGWSQRSRRTSRRAPRSSASSRRACLSLRDEFLVLGLGDDAKRIGDRALLIEEFLAREHAAGRLDAAAARAAADARAAARSLPSKGVRRRRRRRAACSRSCRASRSTWSSRAAAAWPAASATTLRITTCRCAWPSWRCCLPCAARPPDTLIVADGTSCRHQIADGTRGAAPRPRNTSCACWRGRGAALDEGPAQSNGHLG